MVVYLVTNRINGKQYIGQTTRDLNRRKQQHILAALTKKDNLYFHNAIRKHGSKSFDWQIITKDVYSMKTLNRLEIHFIKLYNTFENGYNSTAGGKNAAQSEESKRKISEAHRGVSLSEEHKRKLSEKLKGKNSVHYGKKYSEKHRQRISEGRKGKFGGKNNPAAKPLIVDGKYFDTINEAAKFLNVWRCTVRGRLKRQVQGYRYAIIAKSDYGIDNQVIIL